MIQTYAQPNQDLTNFLNGINIPVVKPTPVVTPTFANPFRQDSFINKNNYLGPNAVSTPMFPNNIPQVGQTLPQYTAPTGTVASITQGSGNQGGQTDTFNYNANSTQGSTGTIPSNFMVGGTVLNPTTNPTTTVPGSTQDALNKAGLYTINPEDAANAETMRLMAEQAKQASQGVFDPNQEYQNQLKTRQSEIDRINSFYQDQINQSRVQNAPEYQARLDQQRIQQIQGGFGGSGAAAAQTIGTQEMNKREQAKAEAVLNSQRNDQVNAVLGKITDSVTAAQKDFNEAKRQGGTDFINAINNRKGIRTQVVSEIVKNLLSLGHEPTQQEMEKYAQEASKLGITLGDIQNMYNTESETLKATQAKEVQTQAKADAELAKTKADTAKTVMDTANWGKMTDYQKSQIAIEQYKAQNPTGTESDKKANAMGKIAGEIKPGTTLADGTPVLDTTGKYFTASGLQHLINNAPQLGLTKEEVLKQFGNFIYNDPKTGIPDTYGLTPADKKIITGTL